MPFNALSFCCGTDSIDRPKISSTLGWQIYAFNNAGYDYVSWPHLSRAIVYLCTVQSYKYGAKKFQMERGPYLKAEMRTFGNELFSALTNTKYQLIDPFEIEPMEDDVLVCGFPSTPHFAIYKTGCFYGQPSCEDQVYEAFLGEYGLRLTQLNGVAKKGEVHELRGVFRKVSQ